MFDPLYVFILKKIGRKEVETIWIIVSFGRCENSLIMRTSHKLVTIQYSRAGRRKPDYTVTSVIDCSSSGLVLGARGAVHQTPYVGYVKAFILIPPQGEYGRIRLYSRPIHS